MGAKPASWASKHAEADVHAGQLLYPADDLEVTICDLLMTHFSTALKQ